MEMYDMFSPAPRIPGGARALPVSCCITSIKGGLRRRLLLLPPLDILHGAVILKNLQ